MNAPDKTYADLLEDYYRADQAWRVAVAEARLNHADLAEDLRAAQAELDCREQLDARLEALVAVDRARTEREDSLIGAADAARDGWKASTRYYARRDDEAAR